MARLIAAFVFGAVLGTMMTATGAVWLAQDRAIVRAARIIGDIKIEDNQFFAESVERNGVLVPVTGIEFKRRLDRDAIRVNAAHLHTP